jgi:hypothetical protein
MTAYGRHTIPKSAAALASIGGRDRGLAGVTGLIGAVRQLASDTERGSLVLPGPLRRTQARTAPSRPGPSKRSCTLRG